MPTVAQARAALEKALQGGTTIDLAAAAGSPALSGLDRALANLHVADRFEVREAQLKEAGCSLSGRAAIRLGGSGAPEASVSVLLSGTEESPQVVAFALALTVSAGRWTFATSFPTLPQTLTATDAGMSWEPSALRDLWVREPTFTSESTTQPGVRMSGALEPSGALAGFSSWVGPWPLTIAGSVTLPQESTEPPQLALTAIATSGGISVPPLDLVEPGFGLLAAANEEPEPPEGDPASFSEISLIGSLAIEGAEPARLSAPLLVSDGNWHLLLEFGGQGPSLAGGLAEVAGLFGLAAGDLATPPALGGFESFRLDEIEAIVDGTPRSPLAGHPTSVAITIRSNEEWDPPVPLLKLSEAGTRWVLTWVSQPEGGEVKGLAGSVFASLMISNGPGTEDGIVDVLALLPSFVITGEQREDTEIAIAAIFQQLFGATTVPAVPGNPKIKDLWIYADPFGQIFEASARIETSFALGKLAVTEVSFEVQVTQSSVSGGLGGRIRIGSGEEAPALALRAELPPAAEAAERGWVFSGALEPGRPLTLKALLEVLGVAVEDFGGPRFDRLEGSFAPKAETWEMAAALSLDWRPEVPLLGQLDVAAGAEVELSKEDAKSDPVGWAAGRFSVNRLALAVRREIGVEEPQYTFRVQFGGVWAEAVTSRVEKQKPHRVVTIQLGGTTLGDVLEELVDLAAPTLGFSLEPPWNVLKQVELSRFTLVVDPTEREVRLKYAVDADLVVMEIKTVGVRYRMKGSGGVSLVLTGSFLGKPFGEDAAGALGSPSNPPLEWDVVNDPPPAIPGTGPKLLELRYLGVGQRVRLGNPQPETVAAAIERLRSEMKEPASGGDPLAGGRMQFDPESQWLLGLDLRVLETVEVAVVFNDPVLYGLAVGLDGERAGALAGLRFEILYKQLAPGLGMFRVELRIPEAFRHIELGAVSLTLGTIVVEVYTNGNFLVDFGFPHGRDYERSFSVQVFPFLGRGGIYFGVLNGATSRRTPAITDGTFSPVLELGVGLAVGVGKEISVGPLSGGAYLELEVIFQGVLGWFHPTGSNASTARYHWAQGIVALHGKVYGKVDFAVIKVAVTIEAYAQATVVFESYRATLFALVVEVEAEAEIDFALFSVSFSFSVGLDISFAVGSDEPTPWTLAAQQPPRLASRRAPRRLAALQAQRALRAAPDGEDARWVWPEGFHPFAAGQRLVPVAVAPIFSIDEPPLAPAPAAGAALPADGEEWRLALSLFIPTGLPAGARTAAAALAPPYPEPGAGSEPVGAASIVEALLRWSLAALPGGVSEAGKVTAGELALLAEEMAEPYVAAEQFTRSRLAAMFKNGLRLQLWADAGEGQGGDGGGRMAFPAPPWLAIATSNGGASNLFGDNLVGPAYAAGAANYAGRFSPLGEPVAEPSSETPAERQSFASRAFCDWCLMVAREAVRQARDSLAEVSLAVPETGAPSLDTLAASLPRDEVQYTVRPGDTVESVAAWLGAGTAELEALNKGLAELLAATEPGKRLTVVVGVAGCTLAADNATLPLASGAAVSLLGVRVQVLAGESMDTLAKRLYGSEEASRLLAAGKLGPNPRLLRAGAVANVPERDQPLSGSPAVALLAATMYVRYFADLEVPHAGWFAQAVTAKNQALADLEPTDPVPVGLTLTAPSGYQQAGTQSYETQPGETLLRIGATLSLASEPGAYGKQAWTEFRAKVLAGGGRKVPAASAELFPGESLDLLAARLVYRGGAAAMLGDLADQPLLDPLAAFAVDSLPLSAADHPTIAAMAAAAGLTVEELASRKELTGAGGLFAAKASLTVRDLPAQGVDALVAAVCGGRPLAEIAAQASRNLLAGGRLPAPVEAGGIVRATGAPTPFFTLTGQQLPAPLPTAALTVTVSHSGTGPEWEGWIDFAAQPRPNAPALEQLQLAYEPAQLAERYPAATLLRTPYKPPESVTVSEAIPRTYGLDHRIALQAAVALEIPGTPASDVAGGPSVWPFPDSLVARARSGDGVFYDFWRSTTHGSSAVEHELVAASTFGTQVRFRIRRLARSEGVYELIGADGADRDLLRELALYTSGESEEARTRAYLALAPVPGAVEIDGLTIPAADPVRTFVVRANMATDEPLEGAPAIRVAALGQLSAFAQLLWEASVAASGFHLAFATAEGGDLPAGAFGDDGTATLWLLAIARDAQALPQPPSAGRKLHPFDNCALVADGLDGSAHALYVEAASTKGHPEETIVQSLLPPATAGITHVIERPPEPAKAPVAERPQARLGQRFSLATARIDGGTYELAAGPPGPPLREDGLQLPRWRRQRELRAARHGRPSLLRPPGSEEEAVEYWRFEQVVPLVPVGHPSPAPEVPGLPPAGADPYRGFGAAEELASARFHVGYADLLGNRTSPGTDLEKEVEVGYTDPLLGPGAWPGATTSYLPVAEPGGGVALQVTVAAQPGIAVPGPGGAPVPAAEEAEKGAARYAEAYYQLSQPTLSGSLLTTLYQDAAGAPVEVALREGVAPLWRFAAAGYLFATAASKLLPGPVQSLGTLQKVSDYYGVPPAELGRANAAGGFGELAAPGQPLKVRALRAVVEGDSAQTLVAEPPSGLTPPSAVALLEAAENLALPLRPGKVLATPETTASVGTATLRTLADRQRTTIAQLVLDNAAAAILEPGFRFEADGQVVTVAEAEGPASFEAVQGAFAAVAVDVSLAELAAAAADRDDALLATAALAIKHAVACASGGEVTPGREETLGELAGARIKRVAELNAGLADLFPAGAIVSLGTVWAVPPVVPADTTQTLAQFAELHASTPAAVLVANPGLALASEAKLVVPGVSVLPTGPPQVPYSIAAGDTLAGLEQRFGQAALATATANDSMPGILRPGSRVEVGEGGVTYSTEVEADDTLTTVTARLHGQSPAIDLAAVVAAIEAEAGILLPGGLLLMPAPPLAAGGGVVASALTAVEVGSAYNLDPVAFAAANASLSGLLVAGVEVVAPAADGGLLPSETTVAGDTLNSVLSRFAARGVQVALRDLVEANRTRPLFRAGARALLPPAPVAVSAPIGTGVGTAREPVFPLSVVLRLQRDERVVLVGTPAHDGPVERADATVPAPAAPHGSEETGSETFHAFMQSFEAAIPELRLGTARVAGQSADLWALDMSTRGVGSVTVRPGVSYEGAKHPRYLALRPLYPDLQSRTGVEVPVLAEDGELKEETTLLDFRGQDVEGWAQRLLADLDLFTSAPYAAAIHADCPQGLERLLGAKWTLAQALAAGLAPVFAVADPNAAAGRAAAVEELARACGAGLAAAYEISTVVQFDAEVRSGYTNPARLLKPAALLGAAVTPGETDPAQEFSLARAATALELEDSFVGFALTIADPENHATIATGPLRYDFDTVEFGIEPVPGMDGYVDSDWLTLLRPLEPDGKRIVGDLGSPEVPVPLRSHPLVPLLLEQSATATHAGEPLELGHAGKWSFGLTYSHQHAEQDQVVVTVSFNLASAELATPTPPPPDVAAELAKYATLAPRLEELMGWYVGPPTAPTPKPAAVRAVVAESVAELVEGVADAWAAHWKAASSDGLETSELDDAKSRRFRVHVKHGRLGGAEPSAGVSLEEVRLKLESGDGPSPSGVWPEVEVMGPDGGMVPLTGKRVSDTEWAYTPQRPIPLSGQPTLRLRWGELNVAEVRNGSAAISALRNADLRPGVATNPAFVMGTATVTAFEAATPLLEWEEDVGIAGASFEAALAAALTEIFAAATGPPLTVSLGYGYRLVDPDPKLKGSGLVSFLPVALYPDQPLDPAKIATAVAAAARTWQQEEDPASDGGEWMVALTLSASTDADARPLLRLGQLVYPLARRSAASSRKAST